MSDLVSIITPSYNSQYIFDTYNSILGQSYTNWEWVITDDNSEPEFKEELEKIEKIDHRVRIFYLDKNQGAGAARNNSIFHSKGRYIAFLDSDDLWLPEKLQNQISFMIKNELDLSYSGYQKFSSDGGDLGIIIPPPTTNYNQLLKSNIIGCLTAIYDTKNLGKCYMPLIRKRQDFGLWLSILKKTDQVAGLPDVLAKYRIDSGMTQNKFEILKWQWRFYRNVAKLGVIQSIYYFSHYAILGLIKSQK
ncbi:MULTISPECIES: glycosyltransferase family 2 protein [Vibrio]|uniref:glycosyltransferase family 2 protein n=1 Tax=Vibrio TaxID=662 RepID=UPI000B5CD54D|nr:MULTISPECIES: glycosyltransferase family 2 protein [Vibrio]HBV76730.1 glycosyltransferase family 2 protein [Vibrio sp.]